MTRKSILAFGRRILGLALLLALVTCTEDRAPTSVVQDAPEALVTVVSSAITQTLLTAGNNPANQKVYVTASIAPAPNTLITVAVLAHNSSSAPAIPTVTGGGMATWTQVSSVTFDAIGTPHKRLTVFRAMSASPGSGPLTITIAATVSNCQWIVSQWNGVDVSGVNGTGAIGQTGSKQGNAVTGLTVGLSAFGNASNVAYGVFGVGKNTAAVTPGGGFAEISEEPSGESTPADLEAEWGTNLPAIYATWASANGAGIGIEIKTGAAGGGGTGTVSGTVTLGQGAGLAGVTVEVDPSGQSAVTGSDGAYTITQVPVGATTVAVTGFPPQCSQPQPLSVPVNVTDGETATADFTLDCPPPTTGAITQTLLTSGNNAANQKVYTTAPIAPAPNTLITVAVLGHNSSSAPAVPTLSGGGMTAWTQVSSVTFDAVGTPHKRLTVFRALSGAPGSGSLTITFSKTVSNAQWIVSQWSGVDVSGVNGAGAIGQAGSTQGNAVSGLTVGLSAFGNAGNVAYGVFGISKNTLAVTPGSGFAEISEERSGESTLADLEAEWATKLSAISATWASANGAGIGVEIKAGTSNTLVLREVGRIDVGAAGLAVAVTADGNFAVFSTFDLSVDPAFKIYIVDLSNLSLRDSVTDLGAAWRIRLGANPDLVYFTTGGSGFLSELNVRNSNLRTIDVDSVSSNFALAVSPTIGRLYTAGGSIHPASNIRTWDLSSLSLVESFVAPVDGDGRADLAVTSDGSFAFLTGQPYDNNLYEIDLGLGQVVATFGGVTGGLDVSPDNKQIWNAAGTVRSIPSGQLLGTFSGDADQVPGTISVSPIGDVALVARNIPNELAAISTTTFQTVSTLPLGTSHRGLASSPDGSRVLVTTANGLLVVEVVRQ